MNGLPQSPPEVALACGGTGGHLFPGLAVAEQLRARGCAVRLLVSPKEVDQLAVKQATGMEVLTLPAVGLSRGRVLAFLRGFIRSYQTAAAAFAARPPAAALAMGGFTGAPPLLAAKRVGARAFLHESNTVPGRANRWLGRIVDRAFVGFPSTIARFGRTPTTLTGTPVRGQFQPREAAACRSQLGLDPTRPVILVMGGSQGASAVNQLVLRTLPGLSQRAPDWQWLHLTGPADVEKVKKAYATLKIPARVEAFLTEMELALGAASAAVSRAGASCLAELAAVRLPAVLVPLPTATDNHQLHNARAFADSGAALLLEQKNATPEILAGLLGRLAQDAPTRETCEAALARWHHPHAAEEIAESILAQVQSRTADCHRAPPGAQRGASGGSDSGGDAPLAYVPSRAVGRGSP